jgi:nitroreductase
MEELLRASRSFRRFDETRPLDEATLRRLVGLTRLCPSAANRQPLKYLITWTDEQNRRVFPHLRWAAALADWPGPAEGERPTGYVVIVGDRRIAENFYVDHGIAAQSMLLAATEQGLGGCMIGSIDRQGLRAALGIAEPLEILLVVALGYPAETIVLDDAATPGDVVYYRDENDIHHVPKRPLEELLIEPAGE